MTNQGCQANISKVNGFNVALIKLINGALFENNNKLNGPLDSNGNENIDICAYIHIEL